MYVVVYQNITRVSQKFYNTLVNNSQISHAFAKVMKVMNWIVRCWAHLILFKCYLLDLPDGFKPPWSYVIVEVPTTQTKFLEPSGYCTAIVCTFIFCTTNVFGCFHSIMVQFECIKHKFLIRLCCMFICAAFKSHTEWINSHVSTPTIMILPTTAWTAMVIWYTCSKLTHTKISQNWPWYREM